MMIKFGLLLLGLAALCTAERKNVSLSGDKWSWVIQNFSGFNYFRRSESWAITTDQNSTIKLLCNEIKLPERTGQNCTRGKVVFNDGFKTTTYCGSSENVLIQGNSSQLLVDIVIPPSSGGILYCKGKSVHPPRNIETIQVAAGETIRVKYPEILEKDNDKAFVFNSTTGSPITLNCNKKMERPLRSGQCVRDILTINARNGTQVSCGTGHVNATGTKITMRVETFQATRGHVQCVVKGRIFNHSYNN